MSKRPTHYRDQQAWPDLHQLVPAHTASPTIRRRRRNSGTGAAIAQVKPGSNPPCDDWVDLVVDFLAYQQSRDERPIAL
jgi:hypothetical protein